jgi:uncharacterized protein (DUF433 family)
MDEAPAPCEDELARCAMSRNGLNGNVDWAEALAEVEKMRRVPGIIFVDNITGRCARISGTGLEVWEVIKHYRAFGNDFEWLRQRFDWLSEKQLRAAVTYYETYPDEINAAIEEDESWTPERVYALYPFTRPRQQ